MGFNTGQPAIDPSAPMVQGPRPGLVFLSQVGEWVDMKSWDQEPIYDSELVTTPVTAGDEYIFFRNASFPTGVRKDLRHTNMVSQQQLPSGWYAKIYQMDVQVMFLETAAGTGLFTTAEDALRLFYQGVARFETGNQKVRKEAPLTFWPGPYGLSGNIERTGPGVSTFGTVNNGVPSLGAVIPLDIPVELTNELTFQGAIRFPGGFTLDHDTMIRFTLHTYMSKPLA